MESLFAQFSEILIQNIWFAIGITFFAGIVSSVMPCSLASIPLIVGYVGTYKGNEKNKPLIYSLVFSLGLTVTFTILGILSAVLGKIFLGIGTWIYLILGILMIIVSLQMLDIIKVFKDHCKVQKKRKGIMGAFLLGILGGLFSTPCSTTVLIAILTFVAQKGNILMGGILLFIYSIGHSILIILAGTSVGITKRIIDSNETSKVAKILKYILSILIMVFGLYMLYIGF